MNDEPRTSSMLLSVDWGTSRLRVRLVRCEPFATLAEVKTDDGVGATHAAWRAAGRADRESFYLSRLSTAVDRLANAAGRNLNGLPAVISGMASASIGVRELPYARAPITADAASLRRDLLPASASFSHPTLLVSGVATDVDVMRGEETQLIGLLALGGDGTYLLPGTHSKHIEVRDGRIMTFRTYVTGELYCVIAQHTVLVDCVESHHDDRISEEFVRGVDAAAQTNMLHEVFAIRAGKLIGGKSDKRANADYLSGLLIGGELADLAGDLDGSVILAASGSLRERYAAALNVLGLSTRTESLAESAVRDAAARGHVELVRQEARLFE